MNKLLLVLLLYLKFGFSFEPFEVNCPSYTLVRDARDKLICQKERKYIERRDAYTKEKLGEFLGSLELLQLNYDEIKALLKITPHMGVAISGGGYRSMLTASGYLMEMGNVGLTDCLSYISGLSGGSWVLLDLILHDFSINQTVKDWKLDDKLLKGVPDFDISHADIVSGLEESNFSTYGPLNKRNYVAGTYNFSEFTEFTKYMDTLIPHFNFSDVSETLKKRNEYSWSMVRNIFHPNLNSSHSPLVDSIRNFRQILEFYVKLHLDVRPKRTRGFHISFTDYWGKALVNRVKDTLFTKRNTTSFSSIMKSSPTFQKAAMPIPIFVANCRNDYLKNFIMEFTPFEFGSWESNGEIFVDIEYLGSEIEGGVPKKCYKEFDDIGFIAATSSSIFNNVIIYLWRVISESSKGVIDAFTSILSIFGLTETTFSDVLSQSRDILRTNTNYAIYHHNPFYKYPNKLTSITENDHLYLVDGGEDGENIPLRPLLIPDRKMDVIFIIDSSSDKGNYANGTKLKRILSILEKQGINYHIPNITDTDLLKPIILGCFNTTNNISSVSPPILIYNANRHHSYASNTSTFKARYNETEVNNMLQNGKKIFSNDDNYYYKNCLACFIFKNQLETPMFQHSESKEFCRGCYLNFCYS